MLHPEGDVSNARFQTRGGAANRRRSWRLGCRQDKGDARPLSARAYRASVLDRAATRPDGDTEKDRETVRSMETWLACRQTAARRRRARLPARHNLAGHSPLARHVHAGHSPHDRLLRRGRRYRQPHARGLLPVLRRGSAFVWPGERPAGTQAGAHRRRGRLRGCQRAVRHGVRHLDARGHARPAGPGRRCHERRVHGRGEGRHRRGQARGRAFGRAGHVRHRAGIGAASWAPSCCRWPTGA